MIARTALASSGSLLKMPTARNHSLWSNAGDPLTMDPAGMSPWVPALRGHDDAIADIAVSGDAYLAGKDDVLAHHG